MKIMSVTKRMLVPALACFIVLGACERVQAVERVRLSIMAKYTKDKDKDKGESEDETEKSMTETSWSSETITGTLALNLKNGGPEPITGTLMYCLIKEYQSITQKSSGSASDKIIGPEITFLGSTKKELTIAPASTVMEETTFEPFVSKTTSMSVENYSGSGNVTETDIEETEEYKGYIAIFVIDGKIVASKANSSRYLKDEWVNRFKASFDAKPVRKGADRKKKNK